MKDKLYWRVPKEAAEIHEAVPQRFTKSPRAQNSVGEHTLYSVFVLIFGKATAWTHGVFSRTC